MFVAAPSNSDTLAILGSVIGAALIGQKTDRPESTMLAPAAVAGPDKENELRPSGTPGGAALRAKQLGHPKRPVSSILTPLGKRTEASTGTPGKGLLRDITNSAHVKRVGEHPFKEPGSGAPATLERIEAATTTTKTTATAPRDFVSIEELLALPDDQLPDIELVSRPPAVSADQEDLGKLPALPSEDDLDEAESIVLLELDDTWDAEIARVLKDIRVDPADFVWATRGTVGDEEEAAATREPLLPCCMFEDVPASAAVNNDNSGEN